MLAWPVTFCVLTLSPPTSSGSKLPFNVVVYFRCIKCSSLSPFLEGGPFFLICLPPLFSLPYFSVTQLLLDKLLSFISDVLLFFSLLSS